MPAEKKSRRQRLDGSLAGLFIGDALAMPVHWYYDTAALERDYGVVRDYLPPQNPHPDSVLWRSKYLPPNARGEILHDQARYWGRRGVHYHQFLKAGENTVNLKLCRVAWERMQTDGGFDPARFLDRYIRFMTDPNSHRDTYLEEYHRNFFVRYARGVDPLRAATEEKHIGGLSAIFPVLIWYAGDTAAARAKALERLRLTHPGAKMEQAADLLADLFFDVLSGRPLAEAIEERVFQDHPQYGRLPWERLLEAPTRGALRESIGTVCYVESAVPAVCYLAYKYAGDFEAALVENTMAGGDNCYRGAVLGALCGLHLGVDAIPKRWVDGLHDPLPGKVSCGSGGSA